MKCKQSSHHEPLLKKELPGSDLTNDWGSMSPVVAHAMVHFHLGCYLLAGFHTPWQRTLTFWKVPWSVN